MKPYILFAIFLWNPIFSLLLGSKNSALWVYGRYLYIYIVGTIINAVKLNQQWLQGTTSDPYDLPIGANGGALL